MSAPTAADAPPDDAPPERRKRGRGLERSDLEREYPSLRVLSQPSGRASKAAWVAVFRARPDAMGDLLADFIKQVHARPGRIGQRPMPREEQVDLASLVYGETSDEPLATVLPALIRQRQLGERAFAERVGMSRTQVQRLLAGTFDPNVRQLRLIAATVRKPPAFFLEYRKAMVVAATINMLDAQPGLATTLYRSYLEVRPGDGYTRRRSPSGG